MKIFYFLLEPVLDFLRFLKHKTEWGVRYPDQGVSGLKKEGKTA